MINNLQFMQFLCARLMRDAYFEDFEYMSKYIERYASMSWQQLRNEYLDFKKDFDKAMKECDYQEARALNVHLMLISAMIDYKSRFNTK